MNISNVTNAPEATPETQWTQEEIDLSVYNHWIYASQGLVLSVTNLIIVGVIFRHEILREQKGYVIMGGLALADGMNGVATLTCGLGRNYLLLTGVGLKSVSRWDCLLTPWNLTYIWTDPLSGVMLLVVSLDRLLMVSAPYKYITLTKTYALTLVGSVYGYIFFGCLLAGLQSYMDSPTAGQFAAICWTSAAWSRLYDTYKFWLRIVSALTSVGVYCAVVVLFTLRNPERRRKSQVGDDGSTMAQPTVSEESHMDSPTAGQFAAICWMSAAWSRLYDTYKFWLRIVSALTSVGVYCAVVVLFTLRNPERRRKSQVGDDGSTMAQPTVSEESHMDSPTAGQFAAICWMSAAWSRLYDTYKFWLRIVSALTSVGVYCAVVVLFTLRNPERRRKSQVGDDGSTMAQPTVSEESHMDSPTAGQFAAICWMSAAWSRLYDTYKFWLRIVSALTSVGVYCAVVVLFTLRNPERRRKSQVGDDGSTMAQPTVNLNTEGLKKREKSDQEKKHLRAQTRLTITLGISCFFMTALFAFPNCVSLYYAYASVDNVGPVATLISSYAFIISNCNPMVNFFIYTLRHKDIRLGVKCLFTCRTLTPAMIN